MTKGCIIAMGGGVDLRPDTPLFKEFFNKAQKITEGTPKIAIIPTASANPSNTGKEYRQLFESVSAETVVINPDRRKEANGEGCVQDALDSDAFFFTGGHQLRITALLGGTELIKTIKKRFEEEEVLIGGTSAGSVCLTNMMISGDLISRPFVHGHVELTQGLGFIPDMVIDTHFMERGRFPRLIHVVSENPGTQGLGIGEGTAMVWNFEKKDFRVIGRGTVAVVDGSQISKNNAPELEFGEPISVGGIYVFVLSSGARYDYENSEMFLPGEDADHRSEK